MELQVQKLHDEQDSFDRRQERVRQQQSDAIGRLRQQVLLEHEQKQEALEKKNQIVRDQLALERREMIAQQKEAVERMLAQERREMVAQQKEAVERMVVQERLRLAQQQKETLDREHKLAEERKALLQEQQRLFELKNQLTVEQQILAKEAKSQVDFALLEDVSTRLWNEHQHCTQQIQNCTQQIATHRAQVEQERQKYYYLQEHLKVVEDELYQVKNKVVAPADGEQQLNNSSNTNNSYYSSSGDGKYKLDKTAFTTSLDQRRASLRPI